MAVGGVNYSSPVRVNGYACMNCAEVTLASRHIDPAHPQSGPFDRNAAVDPSRRGVDPIKVEALRKAAQGSAAVVGYSAHGIVTAPLAPGSTFALTG
ncbi:hypothetical protein HJG53_02730 [Sphingomonas sp. ID1715]|uniref:hypothetical protein n=1 Tax=Sphingomonas sp. ID1715 TaxID=1656898 RepID=UPI0014892B36|nr:hypothetical protein [Sphingomonas sp. ID1715]NNM75821.1 hypothetical protein [Sphingomonas sp. ID1715]